MTDSTDTTDPQGPEGAVPTEVAQAARLWARTGELRGPEYGPWLNRFVWQTLWKVVAVGSIVAVAVFVITEARHLLGMLVVAVFFALAMVPGVNALHRRFNMKRGAAVGVIYLTAVLFIVFMAAVLVPAIVRFADAVNANASVWIGNLNDWFSESFNTGLNEQPAINGSEAAMTALRNWGDDLLGLVTSGIGVVFDLFTIAAFSFYIAADFPRIRRAFMARMTPERQRVFAWITDTSIEQTGGYFYSRLLLMLVNGGLAFVVMLIVGLPLVYAVPLAIFMGFVSEFIPFIGTYIGAAIPILILWAVEGLGAALVMLVWVIIYQQVENYVLSPRFSSKTMELNGAIAFGGALAGGAIAGPMGAFMALPVAALITAIVKNTGRTYAVVVEDLDDDGITDEPHRRG